MSDMEAWAHQLMLERERDALQALERCAKAGADPEDLKTVARLAGLNWTPERNANAAQR